MKTFLIHKIVLVFLLGNLLVACGGGGNTPEAGGTGGTGDGTGGSDDGSGDNPNTGGGQVAVKGDINEPEGIYNTGLDVLELKVKVLPPTNDTCEVKKYDGCTLGDVLNDIERLDNFKPEVKVEFTTSDGFNARGTLRQRGGSSRKNPIKSFRIKLDKKGPAWHGEHRIQLIKAMTDPTRMRHRVNYDLFTEIDKLPSMRTRYVHFKIEDKGKFNFAEAPIYDVLSDYKETDLGIYLQVEYFGKEYLKRRNWPKGSRVYKVEGLFFKWEPEAYALDDKGKPTNKDEFEKRVRIKSGKDHRAFVEMIQAIDNPSNDFNKDVLEKYFDRENYINWMAINLLSNNWDSRTNNYYFYNPKETKKFYFVPWDYDNSFKIISDVAGRKPALAPPYWNTHALYWPYLLHRRFIESSGNVAALKERIIALRQTTYSNENIKTKLESYRPLVEPFILKSPDDYYAYSWLKSAKRKIKLKKLVNDILGNATTNYTNIIKYYDSPMTFQINEVKQVGGLFHAAWGESVSLAGNQVTYDLIISRKDKFEPENIVKNVTGLSNTTYSEQLNLAKGGYFVKVISRDMTSPKKLWQLPTNRVTQTTSNGHYYRVLGVKKLLVE